MLLTQTREFNDLPRIISRFDPRFSCFQSHITRLREELVLPQRFWRKSPSPVSSGASLSPTWMTACL